VRNVGLSILMELFSALNVAIIFLRSIISLGINGYKPINSIFLKPRRFYLTIIIGDLCMRYCVNCGSSYDEDDRYCAHCGFVLRSRPDFASSSPSLTSRVSCPVEFVPKRPVVSHPPRTGSSSAILGLTFICVGLLFAILLFSPSLFGSFAGLFGSLGGKLGSLGGEFGRLGGELGSRFGHLGGELGRVFGSLGSRVGSWSVHSSTLLRVLLVVFFFVCFLLPGVIFFVRSRQHQNNYRNMRWD